MSIYEMVENFYKKYLQFVCGYYNITGLCDNKEQFWGVSSAGLERLPVTQKVEGSSPLHPATIFNWPHRLMVRTPPFQGENPGSNPSGAAKIKRPPLWWSFYFVWYLTGLEPLRFTMSANE